MGEGWSLKKARFIKADDMDDYGKDLYVKYDSVMVLRKKLIEDFFELFGHETGGTMDEIKQIINSRFGVKK